MILDIAKIVGSNVRSMRIERGWSSQTLADMLGTNVQNLSGIERGVRGLSVKQIGKICDAFACLPADLFEAPPGTNACLIKKQLLAEIAIMSREDMATLCANAVALNAARGIKP